VQADSPMTPEDQIVAAIRRIIRAADFHSRRLESEHGLSIAQLMTLREIARAGRISPASLARIVHLSQATMTGIAQRLAARGLIERRPNATDGRSVELSVTEDGRAVLAASPPLLQDGFAQALSSLDEVELARMLEMLEWVASQMDEGARCKPTRLAKRAADGASEAITPMYAG